MAPDELEPVHVRGRGEAVRVVALSPDEAVLARKARSRSASTLLAVVDGLTRPIRSKVHAG